MNAKLAKSAKKHLFLAVFAAFAFSVVQ